MLKCKVVPSYDMSVIYQTWYNWNIVESGIKHHKPTKSDILWLLFWNSVALFFWGNQNCPC